MKRPIIFPRCTWARRSARLGRRPSWSWSGPPLARREGRWDLEGAKTNLLRPECWVHWIQETTLLYHFCPDKNLWVRSYSKIDDLAEILTWIFRSHLKNNSSMRNHQASFCLILGGQASVEAVWATFGGRLGISPRSSPSCCSVSESRILKMHFQLRDLSIRRLESTEPINQDKLN